MKKILILLVPLLLGLTGSGQLYISPGATLQLMGNAQVTLDDMDLINDGSIAAPLNSMITFNGSASNDISGQTPTMFAGLEIAKTGSGLLTLQSDISVWQKIVFTSNLIELNHHDIDLGATGLLQGEKESSRITGINGGEVIRTAVLNAPASVNPGNLGAIITAAQNMGTTTIRRGHQAQTTVSGGGVSIHRYFDIIPTNNSGLNATLRFTYFEAEKNLQDENIFRLWRSDDQVNWTDMGFSSRSAAANYVEQTGLNDFSRWTLSPAGALPVTGMTLTGKWQNNAVQLNWLTHTEYHNSHFTIERKYRDDLNYMTIGRRNSAHADGNSQSTTKYRWTDFANSDKGPILYRLQQHDMDGKSAFSNIIVIKPEPSYLFIQKVFPNVAVKNQIYIQTGSRDIDKMHISIYDMKGSLIVKKQLNYQSQWLNLPQMSAGNYKIFIHSGAYHWEGSFVRE